MGFRLESQTKCKGGRERKWAENARFGLGMEGQGGAASPREREFLASILRRTAQGPGEPWQPGCGRAPFFFDEADLIDSDGEGAGAPPRSEMDSNLRGSSLPDNAKGPRGPGGLAPSTTHPLVAPSLLDLARDPPPKPPPNHVSPRSIRVRKIRRTSREKKASPEASPRRAPERAPPRRRPPSAPPAGQRPKFGVSSDIAPAKPPRDEERPSSRRSSHSASRKREVRELRKAVADLKEQMQRLAAQNTMCELGPLAPPPSQRCRSALHPRVLR